MDRDIDDQRLFFQGAFTGAFSALIFTMWFGFGQTFARNFGTYSVPPRATITDLCPVEFVNATTTTTTTTLAPGVEPYEFPHVPIYEVSYMWFSAIPCMWTIVVGTVVSFLTGPQDPKTLNPKLISPALGGLFSFWPRKIRDFFNKDLQIGINYVST